MKIAYNPQFYQANKKGDLKAIYELDDVIVAYKPAGVQSHNSRPLYIESLQSQKSCLDTSSKSESASAVAECKSENTDTKEKSDTSTKEKSDTTDDDEQEQRGRSPTKIRYNEVGQNIDTVLISGQSPSRTKYKQKSDTGQ